MFVEAAVFMFLAFWLLGSLFGTRRRTAPEIRRTRQRAQELAHRSTRLVDGRLLTISHDLTQSWWQDGPGPGPSYLVYQYVPEKDTGTKIEARHYITEATATAPDLVMQVGGSVRVRYAVDAPEESVLEDF